MAEKKPVKTFRSRAEGKEANKSMVSWNQVGGKFRKARSAAKGHNVKADTSDWVLSSDLAYESGYWLHTYAKNFAAHLFEQEIQASLAQLQQFVAPAVDNIREAVRPNESDQKVLRMLQSQNELFDTFRAFNSVIQQVVERVGATNPSSDASSAEVNINYDQLYQAINNRRIKEGRHIYKVPDTGISELGIQLATRVAGKQKVLPKNIEAIADAFARLMIMSQAISKTLSQTNIGVNESHKIAHDAFDFAKIASTATQEMLATINGGKEITKKLGDYFEPGFLAMYEHGKMVGTQSNKKTATDVVFNAKTLLSTNEQLHQNVGVSLKRSEFIVREQDLAKIANILPGSKHDAASQVAELMKPIRYFLTNFSLIMDHQLAPEPDSEFKDSPIMSIGNVVNLYEKVAQSLGQFLYTNLIVGFLLFNGSPNNKQDLKALPHIIATANGKQMFTYDLLNNLSNTQEQYGDIMVNYTAGLAQDYLAFIDIKKQARSQLGDKANYDTLNTDQVKAYRQKFANVINKLTVWSVIDTAKLANNVQLPQ